MIELRTDRLKLFDVFPEKANRLAKSLHKKADQIEFVRKGIPIDPADIKIEEGERAAIRLITTPRLDRDNEILIPEGAILDDFRQSPTVLYAHDYKGLPIGRDQWLKVTKRGILAKTQYATHNFAEDVYQCVKGGFLNSNSVGFIPLEAVNADDKKRFGELQETLEKDYGVLKEESGLAKNIYTKWILLEHSDVPVASNAQSLNLAVSKGELPITSDRLKKDLGIEIELEDEVKIEAEPEPNVLKFEDVTATEPPVLEEKQEVITKPETTDQYHRIPVEDSAEHKDHRIRTITISAKEGIKALYCGTCKKVLTYLFDVDKFSMEEAKKWVEDHKAFVIIADEPEVEAKVDVEIINTTSPNVDLVFKIEEAIKKHGESQMTLITDLQGQVFELKAGRILPAESRKQIQDCLKAMREAADRLEELYDAVEPTAKKEDKPTENILNFEAEKEPDSMVALEGAVIHALEKTLKPENLKSLIEEAVDIRLKKMRGIVE